MSRDLVTQPSLFLVLNGPTQAVFKDQSSNAACRHRSPIKSVIRIGVDKNVLCKNSKYFKAMLSGRFSEGRDSEDVALDVDSHFVAVLILATIHGLKEPTTLFLVSDMRMIIAQCDYWEIEHILLAAWYGNWVKDAGGLHLLLCTDDSHGGKCVCIEEELIFTHYAFNARRLFFDASRRLVLGSAGRVEERNNSGNPDLVLPPRILQQLNGLRGAMRRNLEMNVMNIIKEAVNVKCTCDCSDELVKGFYKELARLKLYPSVQVVTAGTSVQEIMDTLRSRWKYDFKGCNECGYCSSTNVKMACLMTEHRATGLCLDCVARPRSTEDPENAKDWPPRVKEIEDDSDDGPHVDWSENCFVEHKKLCWVYSFYAREESDSLGRRGRDHRTARDSRER